MARLSAQDAARLRMALDDEARLLKKDAQNNSADIGAEFPRMLYRKTTEPEVLVLETDKLGKPREMIVTNDFHGLLCDTIVVESLDDMELLTGEGWDISPQAAHGIITGAAAAVSAKDARIAELEAMLAGRDADAMSEPEAVKRGPGRPRLTPLADAPQA